MSAEAIFLWPPLELLLTPEDVGLIQQIYTLIYVLCKKRTQSAQHYDGPKDKNTAAFYKTQQEFIKHNNISKTTTFHKTPQDFIKPNNKSQNTITFCKTQHFTNHHRRCFLNYVVFSEMLLCFVKWCSFFVKCVFL